VGLRVHKTAKTGVQVVGTVSDDALYSGESPALASSFRHAPWLCAARLFRKHGLSP